MTPARDRLTADQERELVIRAKAGDQAAMTELLTGWDGFLRMLARRSGLKHEDALQEARLAAVLVVRELPEHIHFQLITYVGTRVRSRLRDLRKHRDRKRRKENTVSLDAPVNGDARQRLAATVAGRDDVLAEVIRREGIEWVSTMLAVLPDRARDVIERRLDGEWYATIGEAYGCSKQNVSQIEKRAYGYLRRLAGAA